MKKIKSLIVIGLIVCLTVTALAGCSGNQNSNANTSKTYVFSVETGDKISVKLDTTGGYDITSNLPFEISQNGTVLSQGTFITAEQYGDYKEAAETDENARIIKSGDMNSNQYLFWSYNDSEFDIVILVGDSNTGVILGNTVSEESAWECFERLTICAD